MTTVPFGLLMFTGKYELSGSGAGWKRRGEGGVHAGARASGGNAYNGPAGCEAPQIWDWTRTGYATLHY